jgi:hypothetical protein
VDVSLGKREAYLVGSSALARGWVTVGAAVRRGAGAAPGRSLPVGNDARSTVIGERRTSTRRFSRAPLEVFGTIGRNSP